MSLLVDAAPLVALAVPDDPARERVRAVLESEPGELVIAAPVTAEIDYLLGKLAGSRARLAFLADLAAGRFRVDSLDAAGHAAALALEQRYADLELGLADAATMVLAARHGTVRIATFDHRDFAAVQPLQGGAFELLP